MGKVIIFLFILSFTFNACSRAKEENNLSIALERRKPILPNEINLQKKFLYNEHTLSDVYPYKDTGRKFQWEKIRTYLALMETIQQTPETWGVLQNNKNEKGKAPLVRNYEKDKHNRIVDLFGVGQYQSIPLYLSADFKVPERYGRDGSLVKVMKDSVDFIEVEIIYLNKNWFIPKKYVKVLNASTVFNQVIFVDRTNQNIATLEKVGLIWYIRSMNPITTGSDNPPYREPTPLGVFVIQNKREKMRYYKDGTTDIDGFAPYACRFTNGAYLHGIPVNLPRTEIREFSWTLGTTPRSHMCVRNASSHAKFMYDWSLTLQTIVIVLE